MKNSLLSALILTLFASAANAQWLSLGNEVDVVIGDTLYQVRDN